MLDSFLYFILLGLALDFCLVIPQFLVNFLQKNMNEAINGISISKGIKMTQSIETFNLVGKK